MFKFKISVDSNGHVLIITIKTCWKPSVWHTWRFCAIVVVLRGILSFGLIYIFGARLLRSSEILERLVLILSSKNVCIPALSGPQKPAHCAPLPLEFSWFSGGQKCTSELLVLCSLSKYYAFTFILEQYVGMKSSILDYPVKAFSPSLPRLMIRLAIAEQQKQMSQTFGEIVSTSGEASVAVFCTFDNMQRACLAME